MKNIVNAINDAIKTIIDWIGIIFEELCEHLNISEWSALGIGIIIILLFSVFILKKKK